MFAVAYEWWSLFDLETFGNLENWSLRVTYERWSQTKVQLYLGIDGTQDICPESGETLIRKRTGLLVGNFETTPFEVPRPCFVGMA